MPQLDWTTYPSQIFWLFVTFFLLWGLMAFVVLPPVQKILDERHAYLKKLTEEGETLREKAQELENQNARHLGEIRSECERQVVLSIKNKKEAFKKAGEKVNHDSQTQLKELTEKIALIKSDTLEEAQRMVPELREMILKILPSGSSQRKKS